MAQLPIWPTPPAFINFNTPVIIGPRPSQTHRPVYSYTNTYSNDTFPRLLTKMTQSIIVNLKYIPPLLSSLLRPYTSPTRAYDDRHGPYNGSAILSCAILIECLRLDGSVTGHIMAHIHDAFACGNTLTFLAKKWRYQSVDHFFIEIARLSIHPDCSPEQTAVALGPLINPILYKVMAAIEGLVPVSARGMIAVGLTQLAPVGSAPLPPARPVSDPKCALALRRISAKVRWVAQHRPATAPSAPWQRIVHFNLKSAYAQQGENFGDRVLGMILRHEIWRQGYHLSTRACCEIYCFLASNTLLDAITPLFRIDASRAFTDPRCFRTPEDMRKARGDLLEAALGVAFIDGNRGEVLDMLYWIVPQLVTVCVGVWSDGGSVV